MVRPERDWAVTLLPVVLGVAPLVGQQVVTDTAVGAVEFRHTVEPVMGEHSRTIRVFSTDGAHLEIRCVGEYLEIQLIDSEAALVGTIFTLSRFGERIVGQQFVAGRIPDASMRMNYMSEEGRRMARSIGQRISELTKVEYAALLARHDTVHIRTDAPLTYDEPYVWTFYPTRLDRFLEQLTCYDSN